MVQQSKRREADAAIALLKAARRPPPNISAPSMTPYPRQSRKLRALNVIKAEQRTKLQRLTAPIDGVVQQLVVHTIGGVVTPVQALAVVVPSQAPLEIETVDPTAILDSSISARRWNQGQHLQFHMLRPCFLAK
jgi:hemolysin D